MAWNEPGGKRPNDPWGNGGKKQGPPDLDELFKKLQSKFKGSGSGSGGASELPTGPLLVIGIVVAVLLYLVAGIYTVEQAERAVVLRFGKVSHEETAGLKWRAPLIDQVLKINVDQVQGYDHKARMITAQQNIVDVSVNVQYRVNDAQKYFLEIQNPVTILEQATSSALRHAVGGELLDSVITDGREKIALEVKLRLQQYLDDYSSGLYVAKVSVEDTQPPDEVKAAFDDVIKAKEDKERMINQAKAYENKVIPEARGQKARLIEEAKAYQGEVVEEAKGDTQRFEQLYTEYSKAPAITRERLYLETMEQIYADNPKVYLDSNSSGNMMYFPLDQLLKAGQEKSTSSVELQRPTMKSKKRGIPNPEIQTPSLNTGNDWSQRSKREGR